MRKTNSTIRYGIIVYGLVPPRHALALLLLFPVTGGDPDSPPETDSKQITDYTRRNSR